MEIVVSAINEIAWGKPSEKAVTQNVGQSQENTLSLELPNDSPRSQMLSCQPTILLLASELAQPFAVKLRGRMIWLDGCFRSSA
jgi:hypothetical protein